MCSTLTSISEVLATASAAVSADWTAVCSSSVPTHTLPPSVSLCYDSSHNTPGPCSKSTSTTGIYPGASTHTLGSDGVQQAAPSTMVVLFVFALHFVFRV
ncbi:hypothetical protein K432DRAFT_379592 [Lepidopterella palustris CBS 459.81]|uniref:Uncharacterized protein n=1 Tax=Lepidopterella palustris CBS 459.81 TaxID=1314670 RepID=A0A8E2EGX4_9PEZI|nr:hypothetical protein K432DRAFT_379592 [Lepidopterella palustris CBS 459.81]